MSTQLLRITMACLVLTAFRLFSQDWPMLGHDPERTGATRADPRPPFERKWYRLFADEGIQSGVQPVVSDGKVYLGTLHGVLHAIDTETGADAWTCRAEGPILHAAAVSDGIVIFGAADGKVRGVRASDGFRVWTVQTGCAVWNAPVVHKGTAVIGGRDGFLYALKLQDGQERWRADLGAPILQSPAIDTKRSRVYVGSEGMVVHAFDSNTGLRVWRSERLPGASMRGYHPVIAPDGSVLLTTQPVIGYDRFQE